MGVLFPVCGVYGKGGGDTFNRAIVDLVDFIGLETCLPGQFLVPCDEDSFPALKPFFEDVAHVGVKNS